ncbi:MAG: hypothetical protein ACFFFB_16245 [Candidatus Heimdallarchaeota archaeon]
MGTNLRYRNLGLGKAIIIQGIMCSKKFNPTPICIDGAVDNPAANRLYDANGFVEKGAIYSWAK